MCEAASGSQLCGARGSARGHVVTWIGWVGGELQEGGDKCIHMADPLQSTCRPRRCLTLPACPSAAGPGSAPSRPPTRPRPSAPAAAAAATPPAASAPALGTAAGAAPAPTAVAPPDTASAPTPWRWGCSCPKSTRLPTCAPRPAATCTPPSWRRVSASLPPTLDGGGGRLDLEGGSWGARGPSLSLRGLLS